MELKKKDQCPNQEFGFAHPFRDAMLMVDSSKSGKSVKKIKAAKSL